MDTQPFSLGVRAVAMPWSKATATYADYRK